MANQTGIFISITAWLPTGKGLDEQFQALSLVKAAHESGDYAPLLAAASIEAVKTESKTRRMEAQPVASERYPEGSTVRMGPGPGALILRDGMSIEQAEADGFADLLARFDRIESESGAVLKAPADETPADEPAPESNVGDAPVDQPSLVPDDDALPNPIRKGRKAA